ncbi:unnamed protein product [Diatraea saccharalis]|uniref:Catalase core domain-containing protein n=1 Tax=Diatraea saccharalis TaxID=40085 RepID=A0A9N9WCX6_9NEOP|nr:unnamed protein product [Diatraea saccharalis]
MQWVVLLCFIGLTKGAKGYQNVTIDAVPLQIRQFKTEHPLPIGVLTTTVGAPIDIRNTKSENSDVFVNDYFYDSQFHIDFERIAERVVHSKAIGAFGYFEVTNDVSEYTSADTFNGIGKKTPVFGRFSTARQNLGGPELGRENKGLSLKMYTKEGNLDFLCLHTPVFEYIDPVDFTPFVRANRRNPKTNMFDMTMAWDFLTLKPTVLHPLLWRFSDYGIPYGYRKMDIFPIHAYELNNKHGDRYLAKFNFRTELGLDNLTNAEAQAIASQEPEFFSKDLYNAIANKNYPSWRLEIDIMPLEQAKKLDYNPFDVNRLWKRGTFKTVTIGRLVFDKHSDNHFRDTEQSAFSPSNLVPGIPGPADLMFKARRAAYIHAHANRVGINVENVRINRPIYRKTYVRDGSPPVTDNMNDAPNYYPNTFNGPVPIVDKSRPSEKLIVLDKTSIDFEPLSYFYNHILENDAHRQRMADNTAASLVLVDIEVVKKSIKLLYLADPDLGRKVTQSYKEQRRIANAAAKLDARTRYQPIAQSISELSQYILKATINL